MALMLNCSEDFKIPAGNIVAGKTVIFPTDTVYGLGTNPLSADGVKRCYEIKRRYKGKKMPVLAADFDSASKLVKFGTMSRSLAEIFWPGKLTIVLPAENPNLPEELVGRERTLAVRVPNHQCCLGLISACGGSLIGTSANVSGEDPLTDPSSPKLRELSSLVDYFVSGSCGFASGISSTVIDATDEDSPRILREGAIPKEEIFLHLEKISKTDLS